MPSLTQGSGQERTRWAPLPIQSLERRRVAAAGSLARLRKPGRDPPLAAQRPFRDAAQAAITFPIVTLQ